MSKILPTKTHPKILDIVLEKRNVLETFRMRNTRLRNEERVGEKKFNGHFV